MIRLLLEIRATEIRLNVAKARLREAENGLSVEYQWYQWGTLRWQCQELALAWAGLLESL